MAIRITGGNNYRIGVNDSEGITKKSVQITSGPVTRMGLDTGGQKKTVRTIIMGGAGGTANVNLNISGNGVFKLADLLDVNSTDVDNNEVVVWDEAQNKYVIKTLPVLDGGVF
jgi:hypothetical protein